MAESPKRPAERSQPDASRVPKPSKATLPTGETARAADSAPLSVGPFAVLPTQFGRYHIEKLLGKGAMGAVYLARDTQLDRLVALKVARVSTSGSAKLIKRMEQEAKAAAKLDHPLICKVYDYGEIEGIRFIALQYIDGEDLKSYLKRAGGIVEPGQAVSLVLQLARALKSAHDNGVLHRDLKPENVMLNRNGEPVIMDFGLARNLAGATNAGLTQGMILGTAAYMSPEQAIGKAEGIDHRSDLYALGVMLFEMLTGAWPFTGSAIEVLGQKVVQEAPSPLGLNPNLPPQLAAVCQRMISKRKEDRLATCTELVAALEAIDLKAPAALEKEIEFGSMELPAPPKWLKASKSGSLNKRFSKVGHQLKPVLGWWHSQPWPMRITLAGCAALLLVMVTRQFVMPSNNFVQIDIDDPTLSARFDGKVATGGQRIPVSSRAKHTLEILHNDKIVDAATTDMKFDQGESKRLKVSLKNSQMIVVSGQRTTRSGTQTDITPSTSQLPEMISKSTGMRLAFLPAGTFQMGSAQSLTPDEHPQHTVRITRPFYLGMFEVTQGEYFKITQQRPSSFSSNGTSSTSVFGEDTSNFPVESISWFDAVAFCNAMSERDGRPPYYQVTKILKNNNSIVDANVSVAGGIGYRLPTEAEWEYACRANTTTAFSFGDQPTGNECNIDGRFLVGTSNKGQFLNRTTNVGSYAKNGFGLFDMHGNVGEWCEDFYSAVAYEARKGISEDPLNSAGTNNQQRVWRGGNWFLNASLARSAYRSMKHPSYYSNSLGIRVACSALAPQTVAKE